MRLSKLQCFHR